MLHNVSMRRCFDNGAVRIFCRLLVLLVVVLNSASCDNPPDVVTPPDDPPPTPTASPEPKLASSVDKLYFDFEQTAKFQIRNTGEPGSTLDWLIVSNYSWLKVLSFQNDNQAQRGSTAAGGEAVITIIISKPFAGQCLNEGRLDITSNGGSKTIPVTFLNPDGMYLHTHEGNNCTQDTAGYVAYTKGDCYNFKADSIFVNDEARSLSVQCIPAGAVIEVFDDPLGRKLNAQGQLYDDWTRITVKRMISSYCINTLELEVPDGAPAGYMGYFDDANVSIEYHYKNGLDGKVSHLCMR